MRNSVAEYGRSRRRAVGVSTTQHARVSPPSCRSGAPGPLKPSSARSTYRLISPPPVSFERQDHPWSATEFARGRPQRCRKVADRATGAILVPEFSASYHGNEPLSIPRNAMTMIASAEACREGIRPEEGAEAGAAARDRGLYAEQSRGHPHRAGADDCGGGPEPRDRRVRGGGGAGEGDGRGARRLNRIGAGDTLLPYER